MLSSHAVTYALKIRQHLCVPFHHCNSEDILHAASSHSCTPKWPFIIATPVLSHPPSRTTHEPAECRVPTEMRTLHAGVTQRYQRACNLRTRVGRYCRMTWGAGRPSPTDRPAGRRTSCTSSAALLTRFWDDQLGRRDSPRRWEVRWESLPTAAGHTRQTWSVRLRDDDDVDDDGDDDVTWRRWWWWSTVSTGAVAGVSRGWSISMSCVRLAFDWHWSAVSKVC